ncbi:MAG: flagellar type III secretion system protein FliR [Rhodospirillaceae bacterium]|nr:flagellar type III secretion system protein FliR [Rhodospirillaceae bacterium]
MLDQLVSGSVFAFLAVFARIGSTLMLLPGFGEAYVAPRIRLGLALVLSFTLMPVVGGSVPAMPDSVWRLLLVLGNEIGIGLFLGTLARLMLLALNVAGTIIAFQTSLANALANDPTSAQQASISATFLMALGVLLIFASNLHYLMFRAMVDSYAVFPPGTLPIIGDMADLVTRTVSASFMLAVQIAAPFLVIGLVFYLGLGLLARLMPQVQVFFIAMPAQILVGFVLLLLGTSAAMLWFLDHFEGVLQPFVLRS